MIADSHKDPPMHPEAGPETSVEELLRRLSTVIEDAEGLLLDLDARRSAAGAVATPEDAAAVAYGLQRRLQAAETDRRELSTRLVESERRGQRLMTLYVATYHLHAHQDPEMVESAIAEIAVDLLGARRFALLLRDRGRFRVTLSRPADRREDFDRLFPDGYYAPGSDPRVDAALRDGALRLAGPGESGTGVLAAVPLNIERETSGVLVILELLPQKRGLTAEDRDLLDLLAAHAASALLAAQLFAVKDRKLRTYRSLLELARGES
jgi:GAF domain-containing protein